jgi:hypothetical protein
MPCVETENVPVLWDLIFVVENISDYILAKQNYRYTVVSSGELKEQYVDPDEKYRVFHYEVTIPTLASQIMWCAGFFDVVPIQYMSQGFAFCPAGTLTLCSYSLDFLPKVLSEPGFYCRL